MPGSPQTTLCLSPPLVVSLQRHVVGHTTGQNCPQLARSHALDLADGHAQHEELIHGPVEACPLVAVAVVAGVEEAPAFLELLGKLGQHHGDQVAVLLEPTGMETDGHLDALDLDAAFGHLSFRDLIILVQAVHEDLLNGCRAEDHDVFHCLTSS